MVIYTIREHAFITEALPNGVDVNDFIWHVKAKDDYVVYRNMNATTDIIDRLIESAVAYHGCPYDTSVILNFIIGKTWFGTDKAVICSELLYRILKEINQITPGLNPEKMSPADLRRLLICDSRYEKIYRKTY